MNKIQTMRRTSLFVASLAILLLGWACSGSELKEPVEDPNGGSTMRLEKPPEGWSSTSEGRRFQDRVTVDVPKPSSAVENDASDWCLIEVMDNGHAFFSLSDESHRDRAIHQLEDRYNFNFSEEGKKYFSRSSEIRVPIAQVGAWLNQSTDEAREEYASRVNGLSLSPQKGEPNDLEIWINTIRMADRKKKFAIRGSEDAPYSDIEIVIKTLQNAGVKRFNLVTETIRE